MSCLCRQCLRWIPRLAKSLPLKGQALEVDFLSMLRCKIEQLPLAFKVAEVSSSNFPHWLLEIETESETETETESLSLSLSLARARPRALFSTCHHY